MMHEHLRCRLPQLTEICQQHGVKQLYAFGSVVDGRFRAGQSDVDLLVELLPCSKEEKAQRLVRLWFAFQAVLACEVDLITPDCVRGKYFKKYLSLYKERIYCSAEAGGKEQQAFLTPLDGSIGKTKKAIA